MSVSMQGTWTVSVKSKNAAFAQRFVIQGSSNGKDGVHSGTSGTSVIVMGTQWSVKIENDKGNGHWGPSKERIGTPASIGGQVVFDIKSDDGGGSDMDYDDLILTCSLVPSDSEYIIYGKVRSYSGSCRYNPCFPFPYLVIDTRSVLERALLNEKLRGAILALYPERLRLFEKAQRRFPKPFPGPDPEPFRPMMIPLAESERGSVLAAQKTRAEARTLGSQILDIQSDAETSKATVGSALLSKYSDSILELAKSKDIFSPICTTKARPGLLLRFQEYDRTAAELVGGPYTAAGNRQTLGLTVSDELGNYIFRFTRTLADISDEIIDIPGGVSTATGLRPDVIAQVIAGIGATPTVLYESGLFSDIANLKRIDLCIPSDVLQHGSDNCLGTRAIQSIGNVFTIPGVGNTLDAVGRITATNTNGPQITRGAWSGALHMFACFLGKPQVKTYTIRYRKPGGDWHFVEEAYTHINKSAIGDPGSPLHKVGPSSYSLKVDGGLAQTVPAYNNIEADPNWVETHRLRKIILSSSIYTAALYPGEGNGSAEFKIEGYDVTGTKVVGAEDTVTLYIDNRAMTGDIASVSKAGVPLGECGLFVLSSPAEAITVRFNANHPGGFLDAWDFNVYYGSAHHLSVHDNSPTSQPLSVSYSEVIHGNSFLGTANGVAPDGDGYVTVNLVPDGSAWLPAGKTFCAFSFEVSGNLRITDGYSNYGGYRLDFELIGISI